MKIIRKEPRPHFQFAILGFLYDLSALPLRPFLWSIHEIIGPCIPTTLEKEYHARVWLNWLIQLPLFLAVFVVFLLPALASFYLKNVLHLLRRSPFNISIKLHRPGSTGSETSFDCFENQGYKHTYSAVTANICLVPGVGSKYNNLHNPKTRAKTIGERIFVDQTFYRSMMQQKLNGQRLNQNNNSVRTTNGMSASDVNRLSSTADHVITRFPHTDFLCFQETYDQDSTKLLIAELHKVYPWIVHNVGLSGPMENRCGFNSGLMLASRYEVLEVDFKPFHRKTGVTKFISTGLMMVKVLLEEGREYDNIDAKVGYIFNTHLQPFQGTERIIDSQMDDILEWTTQFRRDTEQLGEHVMFDILCGDFNTDNMSPGDVHQSHHQLFQVYTDVGRLRPGKDHDWAVGTEMRVSRLMDDQISSPEGLKAALEDPYLRQQYVLDADIDSATLDSIYKSSQKTDAHGNVILSAVGGKRRIDFVLYRQDSPVTVEDYNFVTRLSSLTDHIPVAMTFSCRSPNSVSMTTE